MRGSIRRIASPRRRVAAFAKVIGLSGFLVVTVACSPTASTAGTTVPGGNGPAEGPRPEGKQGGDSAAELKIRLDGFVDRRQGLLEPASSDAAACEDLCKLAASICEVKDKLCEISEERADQNEYRGMCREAQLECKDAQDSCINCVQSHSSSQPEAK